ncbi:MAG: TusE/DsrC/DsvC family sulfur relay protein [Myxococcota bacterium]
MDTDLTRSLDALHAKLDYVVERQRYTEELVRDMTPVAREAMTATAARLAEWEERGWFLLAGELVALFDRIAGAYGPDDVRELSDSVVQILDTVRNVTQPDVLAFANDATDVLHHAGDVKPVGPLGVLGASTDRDVQRGTAIALEILRHLGRAGNAGTTRRAAPKAERTPSAPSPAPAPAACDPIRPSPPPSSEVVVWEGHRFTAEGFLLDTEAWDRALAEKMAAGLQIELTDAHWAVLDWARSDFLASGASPNVRRVASGSGVGTKRMYELFPGTPGKTTAMLAGIPKPVGCL